MIDSGLCSFFPDISSGYCREISGHLFRASQMFILPAFRAGDHGSCSTIVPSNQENIKKCLNIESGRRNLYLRKLQNVSSIILPQSSVFHLHLVHLHFHFHFHFHLQLHLALILATDDELETLMRSGFAPHCHC